MRGTHIADDARLPRTVGFVDSTYWNPRLANEEQGPGPIFCYWLVNMSKYCLAASFCNVAATPRARAA
jgi:hypothetical protein